MRTLGRLLAVAAVIAIVAVVGVTPALAHAAYKSSDPADESTVSSAPSQITAEFTEPMSSGSYMDVTDPCGRDSGSGSSQTGSSMSVQNSSTAAGTYSVFYRAVSLDTHPTEGTFTFTVTGGEPCPGDEEEATGGGGSRSGGGSGSGSVDAGSGSMGTGGGDAAASGSGSSPGREGQFGKQHGKHGKSVTDRNSRDGSDEDTKTGPLAGARSDVPDAPSALEGIPIDGLVITLVVAALIGAAAGKIYFSLSGDGS